MPSLRISYSEKPAQTAKRALVPGGVSCILGPYPFIKSKEYDNNQQASAPASVHDQHVTCPFWWSPFSGLRRNSILTVYELLQTCKYSSSLRRCQLNIYYAVCQHTAQTCELLGLENLNQREFQAQGNWFENSATPWSRHWPRTKSQKERWGN